MLLRRSIRLFSTSKRVGFIGMGNMGLNMAGNLVKAGHVVKGFDLSPATLEKCKTMGISPSTTIKDVASGVDYIVTSLPKTADVENVMNMKDGILESADKGTIVLDTSTISPVACKELAKKASEHHMKFMDSPMSGGAIGAKNGTLTFMVGASTPEDFELAKVILEGMGKKFFHCGDIGTGEIAKIANNLVLGINMVASCEGLILGEKLGIDPKLLSEIMMVSSSNNWCISTNNPRPGVLPNAPSSNDYNGGFQVGLIRKDLALANDLAKQTSTKTPLAQKSESYFEDIENKGHGGKDFGYVFQYMMKDFKI